MRIQFTIDGKPAGKGRPKFSRIKNGKVNARTPDATVLYENFVRLSYQMQCGHRFDDNAPLSMDITAYYQIPQSKSNKQKELMRSGAVRPTITPDGDNLLKAIADSLQGIAYRDDKNIVECTVRKFYSDTPKCIVEISDIP